MSRRSSLLMGFWTAFVQVSSLMSGTLTPPNLGPAISLPAASTDVALLLRNAVEVWRQSAYDKAMAECNHEINSATVRGGQEKPLPRKVRESYLRRAWLHFTRADYQESAADLKTILTSQPEDNVTRSNLAFTYYEMGQRDLAITQWRAALQRNPSLPDAWAGLGIAFLAATQVSHAIDAYRKALAIEPRYRSASWLRSERSWTAHSAYEAEMLVRLINH